MTLSSVSLYLRYDGTLLLARQDAKGESRTIDMALTPPQLLQLGMDALRVAVALRPGMLEEAAEVLAATSVVFAEGGNTCPTH